MLFKVLNGLVWCSVTVCLDSFVESIFLNWQSYVQDRWILGLEGYGGSSMSCSTGIDWIWMLLFDAILKVLDC